MAGRTRQTTTQEDPKPDYQVPPPMEQGDTRTVPDVGGDPDHPEVVDDSTAEDDFGDNASDHVSISGFGVHVSNGGKVEDMESTTDGWDRNADGSMTPNTIPWAGY